MVKQARERADGRALAIRVSAVAIVALVVAAVAFALAPLLMPSSYSWLHHTISESGAQGLDGAWLTRLGFLAFGLGVVLVAMVSADRWRWPGAMLCGAFGVLMLSVAANSTHSWIPGAAANVTESNLHSIAATAMGFAYGVGVLAAMLGDRRMPVPQRVLGVVAVVTSVAVPAAMMAAPAAAGMLQRLMFAIAIAWFLVEAVRSARLPKVA